MPKNLSDLNSINLGGIHGSSKPSKRQNARIADLATLPEPEYGAASTPAFPKAKFLMNGSKKPDLNELKGDTADKNPPKATVESLYDSWGKSQSKADMYALVDHLQPQVKKSISALVGETSPALETKAKLLTIKAIRSFDPKNDAKLSSWVYTQLQPLRRYSHQSKPVSISERTRRKLAEVNRFETEFEENQGRFPSDSEIADSLGWSKASLKKLRDTERYRTSFEAVIPGDESDGVTLGDISAIEDDKITEIIELFYESLSPVEQSVIEYRLGLWGKPKLSNSKIAKKLRVSPARISQISNKVADNLEKFKVEYGDAI
jgi:DNA-directed RNA polymerase specialized sigma subunit|tara:strand:+ start:1296 stop:2252 length:957 start_codon:yes stop_codon:yes gene_type:complete